MPTEICFELDIELVREKLTLEHLADARDVGQLRDLNMVMLVTVFNRAVEYQPTVDLVSDPRARPLITIWLNQCLTDL